VFIPGPATVLTVARATSSGTRVGLATGLGIAVGDIIHTALAVLGISAIILASAFLAFLPQFVKPENGSVFLQLTTLGIILVALGLTSTIFFALCAGSVGGFLKRNPTVVKWQGRVVGSIYCALGLRLALQER
jgi:threonine/homoserine/homoserine lactone efflux protein